MVGSPFELDSVFELDAGSDDGDELWAVYFAPSFLGGVEELASDRVFEAGARGAEQSEQEKNGFPIDSELGTLLRLASRLRHGDPHAERAGFK